MIIRSKIKIKMRTYVERTRITMPVELFRTAKNQGCSSVIFEAICDMANRPRDNTRTH